MRRPVCRWIVLALCVLPLASALAQAQNNPPTLPLFHTFPELAVPRFEPVVPEQPPLPAEPKTAIPISPNTGLPIVGRVPAETSPGYEPLSQQALKSSEFVDPRYIGSSQQRNDLTRTEKICNAYQEQVLRLFFDFKHFYLSENMAYVGIAVLVAAPFANTHADQSIRDWYQKTVPNNNKGLNNFASQVKQLGEYRYVAPAYFGISIVGHLFPDNAYMAPVAEFGDRSLRAFAVGSPMVGILQLGLGANRPFSEDSSWHPYKSSHSASGHAFIGAVPFLTVAEMTDNPVLKAVCFGGSILPAWSRIHTDDHYFSQVFLGWTVAYLATTTVSQTDRERQMRIVPMETAVGMGLGLQIQY